MPYYLSIFNHQSTSIWKSTLFILGLSTRPLSGLVARRIIILYVYLMCPSQLASALIGVVKFYKVYSNTLDVCLRWLLSHVQFGKSWGVYSLGCLEVFYLISRGSILRVPSKYFSERDTCISPSDFLEVLCSCCWYFFRFCLNFWEEAPKWSE